MADVTKILNNLRRQCSRREYCTSDVLKKAEKALEGDRDKAAEVVKILVREKYVDDLRYCEAYAREKSSISGWGEVKIKYMLSAKGIAKDTISQALTQIDPQRASSRLEKLYENIIGEKFVKAEGTDVAARIESNVTDFLKTL